jgi:hypothetical protein
VQNDELRCWSLLKEPPLRNGERRLAVERENFPLEAVAARNLEEQAFGSGNVYIWDSGIVELKVLAPTNIMLIFHGSIVAGTYQFRRMAWYPGNRWMLTKVRPLPSDSHPERHPANNEGIPESKL